MEDAAQQNKRRAFRADFILTPAILAMCVVVALLVSLQWRSEQLHAEEAEVLNRVRVVRTELMASVLAESDAGAIASHYLARRQPALLSEMTAAKQDARTHLMAARDAAGDRDPALRDRITVLAEQMERRFDVLDADLRRARRPQNADVSVRDQSDSLVALINDRIEAAREAQSRARLQINLLSGALASIAIIASVLALFAFRREREHWRDAQSIAEEARAKAVASDLSKTRFLSVASHDMRQPLHALMLYISALEKRVQSSEARDILAKMDRAARSMAGMFSSLLDLARIQSGVIAPDIGDFPLQDVLDRIVAESPEGALEAAPTKLWVHSDPALIERVLRNLVTNAIKHGGGKAHVEIAARGHEVEIAVSDDGPGIAAEDQVRIFDEFVRLEGRSEGLGLGLAIVKRVSELLDMPISLQSERGRGARFSVRLPRATAQIETSTPQQTPSFAGAAVLVVDDEQLAREAAANVLRDHSAVVRGCANEEEAEAAVEAGFTPALIVMDYRIDGKLSGLEFARRLRSKLSPPPAIIVVTGDTEQETLAALRESGFAWLIKPADPRALIETAAAQLRGEPVNAT